MKLDFNFPIKSWVGDETSPAKDAILLALQGADVKDEIYIDKVDAWAKQLLEDGCIEVDVFDAKFIKGLIIASDLNVVGKAPIKNYINEKL